MSDEATRQNLAASTLTGRQEKAALLVAEDEKTNEQIAVECGVKRQTLDLWKKRDDFCARVDQHREAFKNAALAEGFADKRLRVKALNAVATGLLTQITAAEYQSVVKWAEDGEAVYGFDKDRIKEFRGCLDDLAKEMGDRRAGMDVKHTFDPRKEAEAIAAEIGKAGDPAVVEQIARDLLVSQEATR